MEMCDLLRTFFLSKTEASSTICRKDRGFYTNQYDVSSQGVVTRMQDFVENVKIMWKGQE